jgi:tetraacyldisaccharide-1-P 4'-kinase
VLPLADWWAGPPRAGRWRLGGMPCRATGASCWPLAGLARPEQRFFDMLQAQGLAIAPPCRWRTTTHLLRPLPWPADTDLHVVLTEKDAVKLEPGAHAPRPGTQRVGRAG